MNVLIDSSVWIEYFANGPLAEKAAQYIRKAYKKTYFAPAIVIYEVYKYTKSMAGQEKASEAIAHIISNTSIVELTQNLAVQAADLSIKHGLAMADAIVMATAELIDASIVTSDKDFKGLKKVIYIGSK